MPAPVHFRAVPRLLRPAVEVWTAYGRLFLLIQGLAMLALGAWFVSPAVRAAAAVALEWKVAGGWSFAALAAILSGGVLPELLKWKFRPPHFPRPSRIELVHQFVLFGINGVMVDVFYRLQAQWLGGSPVWVRVVVDQALYAPLIACPLAVLWFFWREQGFGVRATARALTWRLLAGRTTAMWATGVLFWTPLLFLLYSLPAGLQFIAFLFANCAWGIILVFIGRRSMHPDPPQG